MLSAGEHPKTSKDAFCRRISKSAKAAVPLVQKGVTDDFTPKPIQVAAAVIKSTSHRVGARPGHPTQREFRSLPWSWTRGKLSTERRSLSGV